ncbi:DUF4160 domain-containing protein [Parasediminibacterium paludis]|uniref:DUF4160 domain-containing protein n=1 Tax=Parasediminibacterium paludis TaxID=908966 RepID=A0ABV8Q054_9BACT
MPTLLLIDGFRFFFYSNENNEPIHVHVTKGNADGKIWLEPTIEIAYMHEFNNKEIKDIMWHVQKNFEQFKTRWNDYFSK